MWTDDRYVHSHSLISTRTHSLTRRQGVLKSVLANEENGLPSFSNFTSEGWFSFVARPAHLDDEYKVPVSRALARPPSLAGARSLFLPLYSCVQISTRV